MPKSSNNSSAKLVAVKVAKQPRFKRIEYMSKEERIASALEALHDPQEDQIRSIRVAAKVFNVPRNTLHRRNIGGQSLAELGGHNGKLTEAQEATLIWYIDTAIMGGFPMTHDMIVAAATQILRINGIDVDSTRFGKHWARRWVEKQKGTERYHAIKSTPMDHRRKRALTPELIHDCFDKLEYVIERFQIHPADIFNVDEIGFRVGCIHRTTVITHYNIKSVYTKDPAQRESITVIECISAGGYVIDPYIIMPSKIYTEKMFDNNLPGATQIGLSENGYTDDELALKWLWHFHHQTIRRSHGQYRLLIFDGHGSHMTHEFLATADSLNIICFVLIAHSTHACQPLDVACFQPEKHWHSRAVEDHVRARKDNFTKYDFLRCFRQIRENTFVEGTIRSAFRKAGIYPTNRNKIFKALDIIEEKSLGDKSVGGRTYNHDPTNPSSSIQVPASNAPTTRMKLADRSFWEGLDEEENLSESEQSSDDLELPPLPRPTTPQRNSEDHDDPNEFELAELEAQMRSFHTDFSEEDSGIRGLDPRWYTKTPFMNTPYGAKGVFAHATFLEKHELELSSPSRKASNHKFRKGAQIQANLGEAAKEELSRSQPMNKWSSNSPFVHPDDYARHVKAQHPGGRQITVKEGLRFIKERNQKEEDDEVEKAKKLLERIEKKRLDQQQKEVEKEAKELKKLAAAAEKAAKALERSRKSEAKKQLAKEKIDARNALIAQGKKPRGRPRKAYQGTIEDPIQVDSQLPALDVDLEGSSNVGNSVVASEPVAANLATELWDSEEIDWSQFM